nr:fumarylacetoacetate hydrolase family protein [Nonomuraea sp. SYSU D8015]
MRFVTYDAEDSRGTDVRPGDVLGSGTCGGGCLAELWGWLGFEAHAPLAPGDTVTISVEHLGVQRCRIVEGPEPIPDDLRARRSPRARSVSAR